MATRENRKQKCKEQEGIEREKRERERERERRKREESMERGSKASAQQKYTWKLNIRETLVGEKCEFISSAQESRKTFSFLTLEWLISYASLKNVSHFSF